MLNVGRQFLGRSRDIQGAANEDSEAFQFYDLEGEVDGEFGQQQRSENKVDADAPRHFGCDDFDEDDMNPVSRQQ